MPSLDTNLLVRLLVADDLPQLHAVESLIRSAVRRRQTLFVPITVVLELEWVLRAFYGFSAQDFVKVVNHLLGLPNVNVEEWPRVADALAWHAEGMDFADALHLQASGHCERFLSFDDRRFARRAKKLGIKPEVVVPVD